MADKKRIKIFTREKCPNCPPAKRLGKELEDEGRAVEYHDMDTIDGLAEASMHDILSTPSIILADGEDVLESWLGTVPDKEEIAKLL